jgi:hypothetical protein
MAAWDDIAARNPTEHNTAAVIMTVIGWKVTDLMMVTRFLVMLLYI